MALTPEQTQQWQDNGYLLLKGFYSRKRINDMNRLIAKLWRERQTLDSRFVIDIFLETEQEKRVYFCDAPSEARDQPYKLNDLFLSLDEIRNMVAGPELAHILSSLLGGFPMVCNSLNFEFGSQQDYHFDTFYMPSPTPNKMVASWVALENATNENGPLRYYPGSHKIPPYKFSDGRTIINYDEMDAFNAYMEKEIRERELEPQVLLAKKGDVLIWHSQLFHGGSPILNKQKTRKSLVTHYFTREDFPDLSPPLISDQSCFMQREAQPVGYEYAAHENPVVEKQSWLERLLS